MNTNTSTNTNTFSGNIDSYISIIFDKYKDLGLSQTLKSKIFEFVKTNEPNSNDRVFELITTKLCQSGRYDLASEFFYRNNKVEKAVEVLLTGKCWAKAKEFARSRSDLSRQVDLAIKQNAFVGEENHSTKTSVNHHCQLDVFAKSKDWEGFWIYVRDHRHLQSRELIEQYVIMQFEDMMDSKKTLDLTKMVDTLSNDIVPHFDYNKKISLYLELTIGILSLNQKEEDTIDYISVMSKMKIALQKNTEHESYHIKEQSNASYKFDHLLMTVHYTHMMLICQKCGLFVIAAKCAITLLRYSSIKNEEGTLISIIPTDKAFFNAGFLCQQFSHNQLAFFFLNRYIDIIEAIDEGADNIISNDEFSSTNLLYDDIIPTKQYLASGSHQDQIRDWVLSMCMDSNIQRCLPDKNSIEDGSMYSGLYESSHNRCRLTGYPIPVTDEVTKNNFCVNRKDWEEFTKKFPYCPWTGAMI